MKKIAYPILSFILMVLINGCSGYEPIFGSRNLQFEIADYSIEGNKKLGNKIYSKLYNISQTAENTPETKDIYILINTSQNKKATAKNSAGKILGYRINLSTTIMIKDSMTGNEILNNTFAFSSTYKVQDQFSETLKIENKILENLIDKTYQDLLIKFAENFL